MYKYKRLDNYMIGDECVDVVAYLFKEGNGFTIDRIDYAVVSSNEEWSTLYLDCIAMNKGRSRDIERVVSDILTIIEMAVGRASGASITGSKEQIQKEFNERTGLDIVLK